MQVESQEGKTARKRGGIGGVCGLVTKRGGKIQLKKERQEGDAFSLQPSSSLPVKKKLTLLLLRRFFTSLTTDLTLRGLHFHVENVSTDKAQLGTHQQLLIGHDRSVRRVTVTGDEQAPSWVRLYSPPLTVQTCK
ncbi:hypothetical protein PoB_001254100 [Plakobranchus ocellatus]|uniref:Uncharacterized protein n=1 Tax=Plakobranchus ocellatus TaxID=259542 RepID=A0AAV3YUK1_9GAST|nr:hypothetical protein PoB_001254100 [Plakobranchus ocellatus]